MKNETRASILALEDHLGEFMADLHLLIYNEQAKGEFKQAADELIVAAERLVTVLLLQGLSRDDIIQAAVQKDDTND